MLYVKSNSFVEKENNTENERIERTCSNNFPSRVSVETGHVRIHTVAKATDQIQQPQKNIRTHIKLS